jgi:hypothetical protein
MLRFNPILAGDNDPRSMATYYIKHGAPNNPNRYIFDTGYTAAAWLTAHKKYWNSLPENAGKPQYADGLGIDYAHMPYSPGKNAESNYRRISRHRLMFFNRNEDAPMAFPLGQNMKNTPKVIYDQAMASHRTQIPRLNLTKFLILNGVSLAYTRAWMIRTDSGLDRAGLSNIRTLTDPNYQHLVYRGEYWDMVQRDYVSAAPGGIIRAPNLEQLNEQLGNVNQHNAERRVNRRDYTDAQMVLRDYQRPVEAEIRASVSPVNHNMPDLNAPRRRRYRDEAFNEALNFGPASDDEEEPGVFMAEEDDMGLVPYRNPMLDGLLSDEDEEFADEPPAQRRRANTPEIQDTQDIENAGVAWNGGNAPADWITQQPGLSLTYV